MKKTAAILSIFCLNAIFTYIYIYFIVGTFDVQELWNSEDEIIDRFLPDIMVYNLMVGNSLEDAIFSLTEGSTMLHAIVLGYFFESSTLYSGLIVNSVFVALTFWLLHRNTKTSLFSYTLLSPFFVYYSVGWTKEIILTLAFVFFLRSVQVDSKSSRYLSLIVSFLSRPQFVPVLLAVLFTKNLSRKHFVIFFIIMIAIAPIWLELIPTSYSSAADIFYSNMGGQGVSVYTDYLKMNVPVLSIIGYLASISKLYFEPLSGLIHVFGTGIYAGIEFYVQIIFFFFLIRSRFSLFNNEMIFNLFLLVNGFVCSLPFSHFRYVMPLLVALIIYSIVVVSVRVKLKTNVADA